MKPYPFVIAALVLAAGGSLALAQTSKPPPAAAPSGPTDADFRTPDPQNLLINETNKGRVLIELNDVVAPATTAQIRKLAHQGFYDGRTFFRVIDNFMDQTGDPTDSGVGTSSLPNLPAEFNFRRAQDTPFARVFKSNGVEEGFIGSLPA